MKPVTLIYPTDKCRFWVMWMDCWRFTFIPAAAPCWKGERQIGPLLIGWQKGEWTR